MIISPKLQRFLVCFFRVCVSLPLLKGARVRMEVLVCRRGSGRSSMHVQSLSEWAPANIGAYSQAYTVSEVSRVLYFFNETIGI